MTPQPAAKYREVRSRIQQLIDFTPPLPLDPDPDDFYQNLVDVPFLPLHEQHLAEELALKAVRLVPSLKQDIMSVFEKALDTFEAEQPSMPSVARPSKFPCVLDRRVPKCDAQAVARSYVRTTGGFAPSLASTFSLHPAATSWSTAIGWENSDADLTLSRNVFNEDYTAVLRIDSPGLMPPSTWDSMEPETSRLLRSVASRNPQLCMWHVFAPTPETRRLFKGLDGLARMNDFSPIRPGTTGFRIPKKSVDIPPDALQTGWGSLMSKFASSSTQLRDTGAVLDHTRMDSLPSLNQSKRKPELHYLKEEFRSVEGPVIEIPLSLDGRPPGTPHTATSASILQHAWYRAVELDTSFIILHSGHSQRIGFRHRHSQTLYLTDEIDPSDSENTQTYNKLHIGLFMCILSDALDRERQVLAGKALSENLSDSRRKKGDPRSAHPDGSQRRKRSSLGTPSIHARPRTRSITARQARMKEEKKMMLAQGKSCPVLLLAFQEAHLQSSAPSSFIRAGQKMRVGSTVDSSHYMLASVTSRIATGATGDVHNATLAIPNAQRLEFNVVVKLAYEPQQWDRMRHEARIYEHLNTSGVRGIPSILGLFEDVETGTLALVMENVGESVARQIHRATRPRKTFSSDERDDFTEILKSIHRAGVRHRDIRPANLAINEDGRSFIIDFDRAVLGASQASRLKELEHLRGLLDGTHDREPGDLATLSEKETFGFDMKD